MSRLTAELDAPTFQVLRDGAPTFIVTNGADGLPHTALTYALAPDAKRIRFCIDLGTATYHNLKRDARAAMQIIGADNRVCLVKGSTRVARARLQAKPSPAALFELQVNQIHDQAWRGVTVAPLTYTWNELNRPLMQAMEQRLFAEMRADENMLSKMTVYFVRHGEVEHHQSDVELTARGRVQAHAVGQELATRAAASDAAIHIFYSPVRRVVETAQLLTETLRATMPAHAERVHTLQPDGALENVRFISDSARGLEEPSLLYAELNTPEFLKTVSPARAEFFRGFWTSDDPMGYWLTHDSDGGAETPADVLRRLQTRLREIFSSNATDAFFILATHSGAMRVLLASALGADPGEPDFCELIVLRSAPESNVVYLTYREQTVPYALF